MRFIKKHRYKLLTLMLSMISIFTLFLGINKAYAYETNQFTYTIDTTNETFTTKNDISGIEQLFQTNKNYTLLNNTNPNEYLLINYYICYNGVILENSTMNYGIATYNNGRWVNLYQGNIRNTTSNSNFMYTSVIKFAPANYNTDINLFNFELYGLSNSYSMFIVNMDYVNNYDIGLQQYYETYYGQIEDNYNQLLSDYNTLQDNYDNLNTQYLNLQQEVTDLNRQLNALQNSYNSLLNEYNLLKDNIDNVYNSGSFYYVDYVDSYLSDDVSYINRYSQYKKYTLTDLVSNQFIVGGNLNIQKLCLNIRVSGESGDYVSDYPRYLALDFNFIQNIPVKNVDFELIDFYTDTGVESNSFVVTNGYSIYTISLSNSIRHITYDVLSTNSSVDLTDYYLDSWSLLCRAVYSTDFPYINSNYSVDSLTYNEGYYDGYNNGIKYVNNSSNERITYLENELSSLESQISDLNAIILSKNVVIEGLREQIDSQSYDYNLNDMIWTIASTPFESFKRIWNVNFFGVNIAELITGFITGLIVIWIIKKFF